MPPAPRARRTLTTTLAIGAISVTLLAACQGTGGLPPDPQGWGPHTTENAPAPTTTSTAAPPTTPTPSATQITPHRTGIRAPVANIPIGSTPGNPESAESLRPWAAAVVARDFATLEGSCWTVAPGSVRAMYSDTAGILAALARPGVRQADGTLWRGPSTTVRLADTDITEGFGCPRVSANGAPIPFDEVDAKYTVHRYLWRLTRTPVSPADRETDYPLVCAGSPLRTGPNRLGPVLSFTGDRVAITPTQRRGLQLRVPVTGSTHTTVPATFTLELGTGGYCIAEATAPGATLDRSSGR